MERKRKKFWKINSALAFCQLLMSPSIHLGNQLFKIPHKRIQRYHQKRLNCSQIGKKNWKEAQKEKDCWEDKSNMKAVLQKLVLGLFINWQFMQYKIWWNVLNYLRRETEWIVREWKKRERKSFDKNSGAKSFHPLAVLLMSHCTDQTKLS